jgi:polyisoprenoid-binding protein YceI
LTASVQLGSVAMFYAGSEKDRDKELAEGEQFLDALKSPTARFLSERVTKTGDDTTDVEGQMTFRCQSYHFIIKTIFDGAMIDHPSVIPMIGVSANGVHKRSHNGLTFGIPPRMPDDVQIIVEAEFAKQNEQ